jgi:hypothetical protein
LDAPADTSEKIFPIARQLFKSVFRKGTFVRLIGVSGSNLEADQDSRQMSLFNAAPCSKDRNLAAAMDAITHRFGSQAITRAALVPRKK